MNHAALTDEAREHWLSAPSGADVDAGTAAMGYPELAAIFGVSTKMVYVLEKRALRKIRIAVMREARAAGCTPREWLLGEE